MDTVESNILCTHNIALCSQSKVMWYCHKMICRFRNQISAYCGRNIQITSQCGWIHWLPPDSHCWFWMQTWNFHLPFMEVFYFKKLPKPRQQSSAHLLGTPGNKSVATSSLIHNPTEVTSFDLYRWSPTDINGTDDEILRFTTWVA